jgi:hypothetical protein
MNMLPFLGSGKAAKGSTGPTGTPPYASFRPWGPSYVYCGIDANGSNPSPNIAAGAVKMKQLHSKTVLVADSVNWHLIPIVYSSGTTGLGSWTWNSPPFDAGLGPIKRQMLFDSGAPNRHGGTIMPFSGQPGGFAGYIDGKGASGIYLSGANPNAGKLGTFKANYLCVDGHAVTLPSDLALRALTQTRNW